VFRNLRLCEYIYLFYQSAIDSRKPLVQTRPCASHLAADAISRISIPAGDDWPRPDMVPCLVLPISSTAWQLPPQTERMELSPLTLAQLLEGQAEDGRCKEARETMDDNDKSRVRENPNGLLVRIAPLDGAAKVYVPAHMCYGVMLPEHYPPRAGHPRASKIYTLMR